MNENMPSNIKQIGSISDGLRIYIEDYAFTYIKQYAEISQSEQIATLIGEKKIIEGNNMLFISGVIKGKYTKTEDALVCYTNYTFKDVKDNINRFFEGKEILGWVYIQPGYGDYINDRQIKYHLENFPDDNQVLLVADPLEKITCFYVRDNDNLKALKGYFVYYDKNEQMHEYMLENKLQEDKVPVQSEINITKIEPAKNKRIEKAYTKQKKVSSMYASLCGVLFLVLFVMGGSLIQSDERIENLETKLSQLDNSYKYILNEFNSENSQPVFAEQTPQTTTVTTTEITTVTERQPETTTKKETKKYTVKEGDTLIGISVEHYGTKDRVEDIMSLNNITDADTIYSGFSLKLPE